MNRPHPFHPSIETDESKAWSRHKRQRQQDHKARQQRSKRYGSDKANREADDRAEAAGLFIAFNPKTSS